MGRLDVDRMLRGMSSGLFAEWIAYSNVEPFGDAFLDTHFATLEAQNYNANRPKGKRAMKIEKFKLHHVAKEKFSGKRFVDGFKRVLKVGGHLKE